MPTAAAARLSLFSSYSASAARRALPRPVRHASALPPLRSSDQDGEEDGEDEALLGLPEAATSGPKLDNKKPRKRERMTTPKLAIQDEQVPESQQPAQELNDLKDTAIFGWGQLDDWAFAKQILTVFAASLVFPSVPIAVITYPLDRDPLQAVLAANVGSLALTGALLLRIWVGWSYVGDRLKKDVGYYEETGWYDGFLSVKPKEVRDRDQLLYRFEVAPVLERVNKVGAVVLVAFVLSLVALGLVAPDDPYAQFDPAYLETLQYDDDAANAAALDSIGRSAKPAYCDSRYYKALAGGNGCN